MKFGKLPALEDARNIKFRALLPAKLPSPPQEYDVDFDNPEVWPLPLPLFGNDRWGCCVVASRANQTLRFEKLEQGDLVDISEDDVLREYWKEQGDPEGKEKPDNGLYILSSLKEWRQGWSAAGQIYNVYAFAEINKNKKTEIMQGIWMLGGLQSGVMLRETDMKQINRKEIWSLTGDPGPFVGGHAMYIIAYTRTGPIFLTWGQRQVATWDWFLTRCDELYGVVDDRNRFMDSLLNVEELDRVLKAIT